MKPALIARVAHEINRAYCASIGDDSLTSWDEAPDWQKASALAGVDMHLANPNATPENSHESWLAQKTADGWKYGPVKDAEKKEHPCCVPYAELSPEQKAKDYLFRAVVHNLKNIPDGATVGSNFTPVKYIGPRATHRDGMYGTQINWNQGETQPVPHAAAALMLKHTDVYAFGDPLTGPEPVLADVVAKEETPDEKTQAMRDSIAIMTKGAVSELVKTNYRVDLDKKLTLAEMRAQAIQLVDQYGV